MFPVTGTVFIDVHDDYIDIRCTYASLHQGTITEFPDQFYHFPHIKKTEKGIPVCMTVSSRQGLPEDALALIGKDAENFGEQPGCCTYRDFLAGAGRQYNDSYSGQSFTYGELTAFFLKKLLSEAKKAPRSKDISRLYFSESNHENYPYSRLVLTGTQWDNKEAWQTNLQQALSHELNITEVIIDS